MVYSSRPWRCGPSRRGVAHHLGARPVQGATRLYWRASEYSLYHVFIFLEKIQGMQDIADHGPDRQALFDVASEQYGYFTAGQAARCGYAPDMLTYHVRRGTFQRVHRGVYRFRDYPSLPHEHVAAAWLATGKDRAVV